MSRIIFFMMTLLIVIAVISCEENFSPKGEFQQKYILNCILRGDSETQAAVVSSSYDVEGFNPFNNTSDPFVSNALIRIWNGDSVYIFKDSLIDRPDTSRYNTSLKFYFTDKFQPAENSELEIEALLPNGKRLHSFTHVPGQFTFETRSDKIIPPEDKNTISILWRTDETGLVSDPKFRLLYFKKENNQDILHEVEIPISFVNFEGKEIPNYPLPDRQNGITYSMDAINKVFTEISKGDTVKENYTIISGKVDVILYDKNLSGYYSSTNRIADSYSVRLDESDFTNIEGGFGIFGVYLKKSYPINFSDDYVRSFGYRPIF